MDKCLNCGKPLAHIPGRRKKKYCNENCKVQLYYKNNPDKRPHKKAKVREDKPLKFPQPHKRPKETQDLKELDRLIEYAPAIEESYNGPENSAVDQLRREEIMSQIEAIKAEKIPPERNKSTVGRQSWAYDQKRRVEELQKQLNSLR